uniref:C1q domain-containing protein n=1 Tax=Oncorhynchus tshawytscha TaxID=74940 RepID=A0AAZ3SBQ8_ONCTS
MWSTIMLQLSLMVCLLSITITTSQSQIQTTHPLYKKGHNITIHSSQLVCSLPRHQARWNSGAPGSQGTMGPMVTPGKDDVCRDGEKREKGGRCRHGWREGGEGWQIMAPSLAGLGGTKGDTGETGSWGMGNNYNATTGKFVCSVPGVYCFTYDITLGQQALSNRVVSGSTVLWLERQDQVWLQFFYSEQNGQFYDPFWTDSMFTGLLIYVDQEYLN